MGRKPKSDQISKREVARMRAEGTPVSQIAQKFNCSNMRIYQILREVEAEGIDLSDTKTLIKIGAGANRVVDPKTGYVVEQTPMNRMIIGKIGDEKVGAFVAYHLALLEMRQGVNKKDVDDLRLRFYNYLKYCIEHNIMPNNMNAYLAIGISVNDIAVWKSGAQGTPQHRAFAEEVSSFFASVHEQAGGESMVNPILTIWWQKSHDHLVEAQKEDVVQQDALGQRQTAEDVAAKYADVDLPD